MQMLYAPIRPYQKHQIKVDSPHVLYVEECGNPDGIPILVLHGGPGSGCTKDHRRFFDPEVYRIVLFDQRGCGRSTPHGCLTDNNTQALLQDIETIRNHLGVKSWLLFAGSWGATLALVYAQTHPDKVRAMVLRGVFLGTEQCWHWMFQCGASKIFPDYWQEFIKPIPLEERDELIVAYHKRLTCQDDIARMSLAKAWAKWESRCSTLQPSPSTVENFNEFALSLACIESHYAVNHSFLEHNQIIANMERIEHIPSIIVHGRYDMVCPLGTSWQLYQQWPSAELDIVRNAGHSEKEPPVADALIRATQKMARRFQ